MIVGVRGLGESRAGLGLDRDDLDVGSVDLVGNKRERQTRKVRAATSAADDDVGLVDTDACQLLLGLETDDRLVEHDVVEDAAE
jgi:hypothetical protein